MAPQSCSWEEESTVKRKQDRKDVGCGGASFYPSPEETESGRPLRLDNNLQVKVRDFLFPHPPSLRKLKMNRVLRDNT